MSSPGSAGADGTIDGPDDARADARTAAATGVASRRPRARGRASAERDFAATPPLEGRGVRLVALAPEHRDALAEAVADGELWRAWYTSIPTPDGMAGEIERRLGLQRAGSMAPWAIEVDGMPVGMTTFMAVDPANRRLEVGSTWLAASMQGTGVNPAAKLALLTRAFETLDCIAVEFRTHWHNRQSREAIARLGAKQDGVLRNHQLGPDGMLRDTVVFSIVRDEWPVVRRGLEHRLDRRG